MLAAERDRLSRMFSSKRSRNQEQWAFANLDAFIQWWTETLEKQKNRCAYCETEIAVIRSLIDRDKIKLRRANKAGSRGRNLELERKNPQGQYGADNCALACAYCNNDKSNIYEDADVYKRFFGAARKKHFEWLVGHSPPEAGRK